MFTGIIESAGKIVAVKNAGKNKVFTIETKKNNLIRPGDSIAIDGTCFTATKSLKKTFEIEAMPETLKLTISNGYKPGTSVNLENPLKTGDKISGHFVTGHIDFTGKISAIKSSRNSRIIKVKIPTKYSRFIALKGSIAINGVSLTVIAKSGQSFSVSLIPYTLDNTNLLSLKSGNPVNIEIDMIARYLSALIKR